MHFLNFTMSKRPYLVESSKRKRCALVRMGHLLWAQFNCAVSVNVLCVFRREQNLWKTMHSFHRNKTKVMHIRA